MLLKLRAAWVLEQFQHYSSDKLEEYFKSQLDRWGGEFKGIESNGRNYRLSTMGIDMKELIKREERYQELEGVAEVGEIEHDKEEELEEKSIEQQRLEELENL